MKDTILQTEALTFINDGDTLDLDVCSLDVYEIVIVNTGDIVVTLYPTGLTSGGVAGTGSKSKNGIILNQRQQLRLFAGNKYPRGDRYTIFFDGGVGTRRVLFMLYGIPKKL